MLSTMRLMLFFDGRNPKYALPVLAEYIRPNVYPRKSNSPSGTLQIRVFSSLTVSFSFPMIPRNRCKASAALPLRHKITRSSRTQPTLTTGHRTGEGGSRQVQPFSKVLFPVPLEAVRRKCRVAHIARDRPMEP